MEYKLLGNTGERVSQLCFGTMSFGGDADEQMSKQMFNHCRDAGINFFDCANVYSKGKAEEILGKLISSCRNEIIITSKAYYPMSEDINARGATRQHVLSAVEESLKRLKTDYIDVFYIHKFDEYADLADTLGALDTLVQEGKIRFPAASNFAAWQVMKALGISAKNDLPKFRCIQPMYNLVKRQAEVEILPMAAAEGLAVMPYSPLGGGLLTGKYGINKRPESGRLMENKTYQVRYGAKTDFQVAERFSDFAKERGYSAASLAVAWVSSHPAVTAPIIGARNLIQLEDSLKSVEISMTEELRAEISALSPTPPPATDRNEEVTEHNCSTR